MYARHSIYVYCIGEPLLKNDLYSALNWVISNQLEQQDGSNYYSFEIKVNPDSHVLLFAHANVMQDQKKSRVSYHPATAIP